MTNDIPDVHANDIDIPPGKMLTAECGDVSADQVARHETLATKRSRGNELKLVAQHAGYVVAGSMMRWQNGGFGVVFWKDGVRYSRRFKTYAEAKRVFDEAVTD